MKIEGTPISAVGSVQGASKVSKIKEKNIYTPGEDQIAVSDSAQVYQKLVEKVKELPDIREEKVKAIMEQIEQGKFNLDAGSIAASLLGLPETEGE